ncbi:MAG: restriction endonuclease [Deltaproteobacteria bacterium]|nr:restriction endonuclease [Deltaproteobacteria bacterium]
MNYYKFKQIFNEIIFEKSKAILLEKIADYPTRYIGLFRPTKPKAKILQNLLQSHEIRFGDAFELVIEEYLKENGFTILNKKFISDNDEELNIDQCFSKENKIYFVEQKIRDDHDSTKKRGQIKNFENKLNEIIKDQEENNLKGFFYFIDPELKKNRKYYSDNLEEISKSYGVELHLFYGDELFKFLNMENAWTETLDYLRQWKEEIPELPETNFDLNAEISFEEIKTLSPACYRKLFVNDEIFNEIILTLFPEKKTLKLLLNYFKEKSNDKKIYKTLFEAIQQKI